MKKLVILLITAALMTIFAASIFAQERAFEDKTNVIQAGIGFGLAGMYYDMKIPPIIAAYDRAVFINELPFSFGAVAGLAQSGTTFTLAGEEWTYKWTYIMIGGRASYHFDIGVEKLDLYAGVLLGYNIVKLKEEVPAGWEAYTTGISGTSYFLWGIDAGARYFFTPNIGAYLELGYGLAYIHGGIAFKF